MKKFLFVLLLIPLFSQLLSQNDSAFYNNIGSYYHTLSGQATLGDLVLTSREAPTGVTWLPEEFAGATPEDIFYVASENKLYIYGKRNILVINPITKDIVNQLEVSNISQFYPDIELTQYLDYNHFEYNPNDKILYCVLEDGKVIGIDVTSATDEYFTIYTGQTSCWSSYYNFFIKYNERNNKLFYIISSASTSHLNVIDVANNYAKETTDFNDNTEIIRGLVVSETRDEFYLSITNEYYRYEFDPALPIKEAFWTETQIGPSLGGDKSAGNMLLVNDTQNNIDKLFCFPNGNASITDYYILDFSTGTVTTKTCAGRITSAIYDGNAKVIISNRTDATQDDLTFINATNYSVVITVNTQYQTIESNNATLDMEMLNGKVLLAKESEIVTVDPSSDYDVVQRLQGESNYFSRIALSNTGAHITGVWSTDIINISSNGSHTDNLEVGGTVFYACHSPANNKIYFYNKHRQARGKVYIYNTQNEVFKVVELDNAINDIEINPLDNNVLVSTEVPSSKIKVIDGVNDVLLSEQSWIDIYHGYIGEMFISDNNNRLYCIIGEDPTDGPGIEIWQLGAINNTHVAFEQISTSTSNQITGVFTTNSIMDPATNYVYAAIRFQTGPNLGWLALINDDNYSFDTEQVPADAFDIAYLNIGNSELIYVAHKGTSTLTGYNQTQEIFSNVNLSGNLIDLEVNQRKSYVYVLHESQSSGKSISTVFSPEPSLFIDELPSYSYSMKFNPASDFLYVHVPYQTSDDQTCLFAPTSLIEILDNSDNIEHIVTYTFEDFHRNRYNFNNPIPAGHSIIFDNDNGYLYFGGGGHNLIHSLELPVVETLQLRENITWLSVPRHERSFDQFSTSTEIVFRDEYISGNPIISLELIHNYIEPVYPHQEGEEESLFNGTNWSHEQHMNSVNSTRGYKLEIAQNQTRTLYMFGAQEDPYTTIDFYEDKSNWIGYFIEEEQDIFDALGSTADDIYHIKHQDWTCIFTQYPWFGPIDPGFEPRWYCDHPQTNIKYGEMVVVKPFDNVTGFQWNNPGQGTAGGALAMPQNFIYEEEPDYQTYVIALDSADNPMEIGIFVGDTCVGACVVESQDTIAIIKGYNTGSTNDSISFEPYYGSKSTTKKRIKEYYVYNEQVNRSEKRAIQSGELKEVYFISFNARKVRYAPNQNELNQLTVYPNPVDSEFTIEFDIPQEAHLTINLFDLYGRLVKTVYNGTSTPGKHISKVKLTDQRGMVIPEGLYILQMETNTGQITSQKIMVR